MDAFVNAFESAIKLLELRHKRKDKYYEQFVHVCYESAQAVRDDFIAIFTENEGLIRNKRCLELAADHLAEQRQVTLSKRDFLRANLDSIDDFELTEFELGLKRLVIGYDLHALMSNQNELRSLIRLMNRSENKEKQDVYINHALYLNKESIRIVEKSWSLINVGYAQYKKEYLNR